MKYLLFLLLPLLAACSPSFGGGGFIIPLLCLIGGGYFLTKWIKSKSDSYKWFGLALVVAAATIAIWMLTAK